MQPKTFQEAFLPQVRAAGITHAVGVPDGWLAPLISQLTEAEDITYVPAAREEEALAIASGFAMAGRRAILLTQNVGLLNGIGCFATLCQNYRTPFVLLVANRGNLFDRNSYDIPKIRYMDGILSAMNLLTTSYYAYKGEPDLIKRLMERAETAQEPAVLLLDYPPNQNTVQ
jgi:sulfopyruvate decarboxylase TPP-binding subunit